MLTSRERIKRIIHGQAVDRPGFWLGDPHPDTWPLLLQHFDCQDDEGLRLKLGDDLRWVRGDAYHGNQSGYKFPHLELEGLDVKAIKTSLKDYPWPDPAMVDYSQGHAQLAITGEYYRAGGMWNTFYHDVAGIFGLENYFMLMHLEPDLIHDVTRRVAEFYLETNSNYFATVGGQLDAYFFGNDFGTQLDLMFAPESFDEFILPWLKAFTDQAHSFDLDVMFHSCGSIYRIIDRLIEIGIDCLHPLQARATNMDADYLSSHFKGQITFMGGIDTQELLVHAQPSEVAEEVQRVHSLLGPGLIISPSHEAILPNVNLDNIEAMAKQTRSLKPVIQ